MNSVLQKSGSQDRSRQNRMLALCAFATLAIATVLVYWPSLSGGYLFDDSYYIQNPVVQVTSLRLGAWAKAAFSQVGTGQFRALGMLSFAANYYLTGPDPWWFKFTNLCVHLLNGLLWFLVLRELLGLASEVRAGEPGAASGEASEKSSIDLVAVLITGLWLLAPINLTAVAYISQRLEAMANVFVLLGLMFYLRERRRQFATCVDSHRGWIAIVAFTCLGLLAKESAALLPAFTACIEYSITRFRHRDASASRTAIATHVVLVGLPALAIPFWVARWDFAGIAHFRTFTVGQRLMTEGRVLVDYICWTVAPQLKTLTFYHDDIPISHGLFNPPTTIASFVLLAALAVSALFLRQRRPLFCLGILWFFAGHAMTGTFIPLEIAFEHRNYFPSAGIFLALVSLLPWDSSSGRRIAIAATVCLVIALFGSITFLRAEEWSSPLRLAYAEADKRPDSMRAQYGLAQTLIVAAGKSPKSPLLDASRKILIQIMDRPDSGIGPAQALIFIDGRAHRPIDPAFWQSILRKLHNGPPSVTDIQSIIFLYRCMQHGDCPLQKQEMLQTFLAAMDASGNNPDIMSVYSDFAFLELHDPDLSERLTKDVVANSPSTPTYRENLVKLYLQEGKLNEAEAALAPLRSLNQLGRLDDDLAQLQEQIAKARKSRSAPTATNSRPAATGSVTHVPEPQSR